MKIQCKHDAGGNPSVDNDDAKLSKNDEVMWFPNGGSYTLQFAESPFENDTYVVEDPRGTPSGRVNVQPDDKKKYKYSVTDNASGKTKDPTIIITN